MRPARAIDQRAPPGDLPEIDPGEPQPDMRQRPSTHFLILLSLLAINGLAYLVIYRAGLERGFAPSILLAVRDLFIFLPLLGVFIWLARSQRYAGDWTLLTVVVLLFGVGQFTQYRLFTDPEYSAGRRALIQAAREAKGNTIRQQTINEQYDAEKKRALFSDPDFRIPSRGEAVAEPIDPGYWTFERITTSLSTLIPLLGVAGMALAFALMRRDLILIRLQRHSLIIGLATLLPFIVIALFYSRAGKFLGNTTPWEPVKITFLISYAGILADHYRYLSRTRWGVPPLRFLLPFLVIALMPVASFFALSDFGQMLVFLGAYLTLYLVAVRRIPQLGMAAVLALFLLGGAIMVAGLSRGLAGEEPRPGAEMEGEKAAEPSAWERIGGVLSRGIPRRIHQRLHLWRQGGIPPVADEQWWWASEPVNGATVGRFESGAGFNNEELWYNRYAYQPAQALFGISDGRLLGKGLGRGYPESVPIADSDFIYAAVAEELGLLGGAVLLVAFLLLVLAGMRTAMTAPDMFTKLLAAGITSFLGLQAIVNVGGVIRMLPMTGITLPFVSHGGWSLVTSFCMLGMLMAISHRNQTVKV